MDMIRRSTVASVSLISLLLLATSCSIAEQNSEPPSEPKRYAIRGNVIVAESDTGSPVYLRDVAEIHLGYKKPTGVVKNFGTQCLAINCIRDTGANVLKTMEGLRKVKDGLNEDLLRRPPIRSAGVGTL